MNREEKMEVSRMKNKELRALMESRKVQVEMSEADVLILHAFATLSDGRDSLVKIVRKWVSPVAMKILEERKEYN